MIKIGVDVSYSHKKPLTHAEELRLAENIRRMLQHHLTTACCQVVRDAEPPKWEGDFILSRFLDIDVSIAVQDAAPAAAQAVDEKGVGGLPKKE